MRDDLAAAFRSLRSSRGFTVVALIVLTLGIGATTAIFSVVDAVVLRGLPFDEHDRLVAVGERERPGVGAADSEPGAISHAAPQNYLDWVAGQRVFESMAAIGSGWLTLRLPGVEPESLIPQRVTASFFDVLRVRPAIGRAFSADERGRRTRQGRRAERRPLAPPVWRRPERDRPRRAPGRRRRGGRILWRYRLRDRRRHAAGVCLPCRPAARHGHLGAVRRAGRSAHPQPGVVRAVPAGDRAAVARRVARPGQGADGRAGAGHRARQPAVEQEPRDRRPPAGRPHRRRAHAVVDADAARRRRHRPADRLRQHRQPAAGPRQRASARGRHPRHAGRQPLAPGAATAD